MTSQAQKLQADIAGLERAIRHLIGEDKALRSKIARTEAKVRLERARLRSLLLPAHPHPGARFADFSSYQASVNLVAAKAGGFGGMAVTKLTEGGGWVDQDGSRRLDLMSGAGIPIRGGYHYLHPSVSGKVQAEHFLNNGGAKLGGSDRAICDLEQTDGQPAKTVRQVASDFAATVHQHIPAVLCLYGGGPFLSDNGVPLAPYTEHWLPAYVGNPRRYMIYGPGRTTYWQHTDGIYGPRPHSCPGIGPCDLSIVL